MIAGYAALDTNLLIRFFTGDDPEQAERVRQLLAWVERNQGKVVLSPIVVFETVCTLEHSYQLDRSRIREMLKDLISLRGVQLPNKGLYLQALDLYAEYPRLSFGDAYNASYMASLGLNEGYSYHELYSYDEDFDQLPGIARFEP